MDDEEGFGCFIKGEISASHRKAYSVIKYALSYVRMIQGKHLLCCFFFFFQYWYIEKY